MFLRPSTDLTIIRRRHDFISVMLRPDNALHVTQLGKSLKGIRNLHPFAYHTIDIYDTLRSINSDTGLDLIDAILAKLDVDLAASADEGRTVINPNLDPELDELKHFHSGLESLLSQVAIEIAATLPQRARAAVNVIYFPQLGFNIAMALQDGLPLYDGTDESWEKVFVTENRAYYKDARMREMDEKLGDIYGQICALVHGATLHKLARPRMVEENVIHITGGR
ncbi:MutS protein msh5 [Ascosphaera acerosa]|nr:MutS protein msh5 [Ascosphaera acerosa]